MDFPVTTQFAQTANPVQLHAEARGAKQNWPASFVQADGGWRYRVDRDDIDRAAVQAALDAHTPDPEYGQPDEDRQLRALRTKAQQVAAGDGTFTAVQIQKILAHLILRATR